MCKNKNKRKSSFYKYMFIYIADIADMPFT